MTRLSLCLALALVPAVVGTAVAKEPVPGQKCTATKPLALKDKPNGRTTATAKPGVVITVGEILEGWAKVDAGSAAGFVPAKALATRCPPAGEADLAVGAACTLTRSIAVASKPKNKGPKVKLAAGAVLSVIAVDKATVQVAVDGNAAYVGRAVLTKACTWSAPQPTEPPAPLPEVAATEPPPGATEPPTADLPATADNSTTPPAARSDPTTSAVGPPPEPETKPASTPTGPATTEAATSADKMKVAVMDLRGAAGIDKDLSASLTAIIPQTLDGLGTFKAISSQDIAQMLAFEKLKDNVGCDDVTCLAEIGGALGADYLVSGNILLAGDTYLLQLQLMNIRQARVDARSEREYTGTPKGLFEEVRTATKLLVRSILDAKSGRLVLVASEEGATIRIDGSIVGTSPLSPLSVAGGTHTVLVEKEGFVRFVRDVDIQAGQDSALSATLLPSDDFRNQYRARTGRVRLLAWSAGSVGAAGLVASGVLYAVTRARAASLRSDIKAYAAQDLRTTATANDLNKRRDQIGQLDRVTLVALGVGGAALATGISLYLTGDDPSRYEARASADVIGSSIAPAPPVGSWRILPEGLGVSVVLSL